ncbi:TonB-dependent receptor [Parasphingorhabdus sp. JC815]|uniref:TonB-dependent receptor n=1 Tax=Parasphingorhabdus sp. JC815 TaxID=3232140 RepID=UPI00345AEF9B
MRKSLLLAATAITAVSSPALAQDNRMDDKIIIVTAQRQAQSLQDVPIAVSAFDSTALEAQQIENSSDLQLTLPNITFTKTNFTSSSFTIRGIGDLCTGVTCDSATAIHLNESPLFQTRLFETEFYDLERVEVLRGPQGTLFGRSATSGVVNVVTTKPRTDLFEASIDGEYGNYQSFKVKGMVNVPIGETLAARIAGVYINRDGFTKNLFDNSRIDGRDLYSIRGSLRWEPGPDTTVDFMASYFREDDDRMRIQKQLCQTDPTGVLGCLNNRLDASPVNGNSTLAAIFASTELLSIAGIPTAFALGSLENDPDIYANSVTPSDPRKVNTAFTPEYFTSELIFQGRVEHNFGPISAQLSGTYQEIKVDSRQDYNLNVGDKSLYTPGLTTLAAAAAGLIPGLPAAYFAPAASALNPGGPGGGIYCTSDTDPTGLGSFGGNAICGSEPLQFDRSNQKGSAWSGEAIISSDLDGMFNFLLGGIYAESDVKENSYYVNAFGLDYSSAILGSFGSLAGGLPPSHQGQSFYRNNTDNFNLKSYGIFGEAYFDVSDRLKFTVGLRYNNDKKSVRARTALLNSGVFIPYTLTGNIDDTPYGALFDADLSTPCTAGSPVGAVGSAAGCEPFQNRKVSFDKLTGRAVIDYKITDDNLLYISYSRGYKSGGINPPLSPVFTVNEAFRPEKVDAFEVGLKNSFADGALQLNLTGFYYKYKDLQLSRIVARTSVNDNVGADIYGLEAEAVIRPDPDWVFNLGFSYLHTKVSEDKFLSNPRDPGGGRSDAVIIKDLSNASNCAVVPTVAGNVAGVNGFVAAVNAGLGLNAPQAFPADGGIASTGAYSICSVLAGAITGGNLPFEVLGSGVPVNIRGNELPQAPNVKFSVGAQYTANFNNGMSLVPRLDIAYTGNSYGSIFNSTPDRIEGFTQANAQVQLNGADNRWYVRGFIQNIFDSNSITGQYVTDASSGLYTNVFTLDPRRYGIGAGFKF